MFSAERDLLPLPKKFLPPLKMSRVSEVKVNWSNWLNKTGLKSSQRAIVSTWKSLLSKGERMLDAFDSMHESPVPTAISPPAKTNETNRHREDKLWQENRRLGSKNFSEVEVNRSRFEAVVNPYLALIQKYEEIIAEDLSETVVRDERLNESELRDSSCELSYEETDLNWLFCEPPECVKPEVIRIEADYAKFESDYERMLKECLSICANVKLGINESMVEEEPTEKRVVEVQGQRLGEVVDLEDAAELDEVNVVDEEECVRISENLKCREGANENEVSREIMAIGANVELGLDVRWSDEEEAGYENDDGFCSDRVEKFRVGWDSGNFEKLVEIDGERWLSGLGEDDELKGWMNEVLNLGMSEVEKMKLSESANESGKTVERNSKESIEIDRVRSEELKVANRERLKEGKRLDSLEMESHKSVQLEEADVLAENERIKVRKKECLTDKGAYEKKEGGIGKVKRWLDWSVLGLINRVITQKQWVFHQIVGPPLMPAKLALISTAVEGMSS